MKNVRQIFFVPVATLLLGSCGRTADEGVLAPPSPTMTSASAPQAHASDTPQPDHEELACTFSALLSGLTDILAAESLSYARDYPNGKGGAVKLVKAEGLSSLHSKKPAELGDQITAAELADDELFVDPSGFYLDGLSIDRLVPVDGNRLVLFVQRFRATKNESGPILKGVGSMSPDGSISLLGACPARWNTGIVAAADKVRRLPDAEFFWQLSDAEGDLAATVSRFVDGGQLSRIEAWDATPQRDRSLSLSDIPAERLDGFKLAGLALTIPPDFPEGFISLVSPEGISTVFSTTGVSGPLPVLIPRRDVKVEILFSTSALVGDGETRLIGSMSSASIDEQLGVLLSLKVGGEGPASEVRNLSEGELARLLGMTVAEVEDLRAELLGAVQREG